MRPHFPNDPPFKDLALLPPGKASPSEGFSLMFFSKIVEGATLPMDLVNGPLVVQKGSQSRKTRLFWVRWVIRRKSLAGGTRRPMLRIGARGPPYDLRAKRTRDDNVVCS